MTSPTPQTPIPAPDALIDVEHPDVLQWADSWSQRTVEALDQHPLRAELERRIRDVLDTDDRIPFPLRRGERLFNFWRDAGHPRGLWRATDPASYLAGTPSWETLIDVDALAESEDENWVWKGAHVISPSYDRALIRLSRGGADASVLREFDLQTNEFVTDHPFLLEEAKSDVSWIDRDTLLVSTDMGEGSLTDSGYPARVYTWQRGQQLADAELFFAGTRADVAVGAWSDNTPGWERIIVQRALDFYRNQYFVLTDDGLRQLSVPEDAQIHAQCDPATFARDFGCWYEHGYVCTRLAVVNAFPGTHHSESFGLFEPIHLGYEGHKAALSRNGG